MPINARDYALRLLAVRPRSVSEMRDRLKRKGCGRQEIDEVVADLADLGLLDDSKFASQWIESRIALRPMGTARLRSELVAKGVDRGIIDQTLSKYSPEFDEKTAALTLARKKMKSLLGLEPEVARRRLAGFLARRGFAAGTIAETMKTIKLDQHEIP